MAFEEFDKRQAAVQHEASVSIQKNGIFSFNEPAYEALGKPHAIVFLYDAARQVIGFRAAASVVDPNAYDVRANSRGAYLVTGTLFTRHYGIPTDSGRRWLAHREDGLLCIDISKPPVYEKNTYSIILSEDEPF